MKHFGKRKDANHTEIVKDLEKVGVCVIDNSDAGGGILDLITHYEHTVLIEIKFGAKAEFKRSQLELLTRWKGFCGYAKNFDEARQLAYFPFAYALDSEFKQAIEQFLIRWHGKKILVSTFEKEINKLLKRMFPESF